MRLQIESKGDFSNVKGWLSGVVNRSPVPVLRQIASDGEVALSDNTPKDTGETASGWVSEINTSRQNDEVSWMNIAHPGASVNVARIIDLGHGTGNGGYVPPNPYIARSMRAVWKESGDRVTKELLK